MSSTIDEELPPLKNVRYLCCCRCTHVRTGTFIIGVLELVYLAYQFISTIIIYREAGSDHQVSTAVTITGVIIGVLTIGLMFWGIFRTKPFGLIPHLIMQVMTILVLFSLVVICLLGVTTGTSLILQIVNAVDSEEEANQLLLPLKSANEGAPAHQATSFALRVVIIVIMLVLLLGMVLEIWFFTVVFRCLKYLQAKVKYDRDRGGFSTNESSVNGGINSFFPLAERFKGLSD